MGAHQIVRQPALGIETPSRTERCLWRLGSGLDSAGLITHRTKVQSPPRDQAKSLDYDFHWVSNPTVRTGAFRWPGKRGVRSHRQSVSGVYLPSGPRSGRSGGLKQLHQIALRVLQRRDPYGTVIRGILDELDPSVLQAFPVARKVVARETDHVSRRVGIATMHVAVRAQPEPAEDYETGRFPWSPRVPERPDKTPAG